MPKPGRKVPRLTLAFNLAARFGYNKDRPATRSEVGQMLSSSWETNPGLWPEPDTEEANKLVASAIRYLKKSGMFKED